MVRSSSDLSLGYFIAIRVSRKASSNTGFLHCCGLPPETFACLDECAGSFASRRPVTPLHVQVMGDLPAALLERGVELRLVPDLWPLRDAVVAFTLPNSLIRMQNALRRGLCGSRFVRCPFFPCCHGVPSNHTVPT